MTHTKEPKELEIRCANSTMTTAEDLQAVLVSDYLILSTKQGELFYSRRESTDLAELVKDYPRMNEPLENVTRKQFSRRLLSICISAWNKRVLDVTLEEEELFELFNQLKTVDTVNKVKPIQSKLSLRGGDAK